MTRPLAAWLYSLPLVAAGSLTAHAAAYQFVGGAETPHHHLAGTGHGYLPTLHRCLALCSVLLLIGFAALALERRRGRRVPKPPLWLFGLLPPVAFAAQEHVERLAITAELPLDVAGEATFVVGLLLQVPFALAAYVVARALLRVADVLLGELGGRRAKLWGVSLSAPASFETRLPRLRALAFGSSGRGPPLLAA